MTTLETKIPSCVPLYSTVFKPVPGSDGCKFAGLRNIVPAAVAPAKMADVGRRMSGYADDGVPGPRDLRLPRQDSERRVFRIMLLSF